MDFINDILIYIRNNQIGIIVTVFISVSLIPFVIWFVNWVYRNFKPLKISPGSKRILASKDGNNYNEEFFIYLINYTQRAYYDINITSEFPKDVTLDIYPEQSDFDVTLLGSKNGGVYIGKDFIINGKIPTGEMNSTQLVINNIGAKGQIKMKVNIHKGKYNKDFIVKFKIGNFSKIAKSSYTK